MFDEGKTEVPKPTFRDKFDGRVNESHEAIYANIRHNIKRHIPQVQWHPPNDYKIALLCGGPSLRPANLPKRGYKFATINNTHEWLIAQGKKPSVHIMLDAREFNHRFIETPVPGCKYLLCSQVHPRIYDTLLERGNEVYIWHGVQKSSKLPEHRILQRYYQGRWQNVMGGCTAGTRAFGLLYLLGIRHLRVYGFDSCLFKDRHHAYPQPENDGETVSVKVGRRKFRCHLWMLAQLDDFLMMGPHIPEDLQFGIEGDGIIAYIVNQTTKLGRVPTITVEK